MFNKHLGSCETQKLLSDMIMYINKLNAYMIFLKFALHLFCQTTHVYL